MIAAKISVTLGIRGPILCKATATSAWGIDATFERDFRGRPVIRRSHIKGKLREALLEIGNTDIDIETWLGKRGKNNTGLLVISDFYNDVCPKHDAYENRLTRTSIDRNYGVVKDTALVFMENAFPLRKAPYLWRGSVEFVVADEKGANEIHQNIKAGLKWIAAFGSEKAIGFGRLETVKTCMVCNEVEIPDTFTVPSETQEWLTLTIKPQEPLIIGGVKRKSTTYMESETIITGGMIKGALAETINTLCGTPNPAVTRIDEQNANVALKYPVLAKCFEQIRFTHAFPSASDIARPVVIPYSAVVADGAHYDVALCKGAQAINNIAPRFQVDWKKGEFPPGFGWGFPRRVSKTRTAIDKDTRRAEENKMFTYGYVCPVEDNGADVFWVGCVKLPEGAIANGLQAELEDALKMVTRLGKRRSTVKIEVSHGKRHQAATEDEPVKDNLLIITLQSDALMVNPDDLLKDQSAMQLMNLYTKYWEEISDKIILKRFFAHQCLRGGYQAEKRKIGGVYYPFYLTGAGSVFVLEANSAEDAKKLAEDWKKNGLKVPAWVMKKYDNKDGNPLWYNCPFVNENGYGEVTINLKWHFEKKIKAEGGAL